VNGKRILGIAAAAVILFFVIAQPGDAAGLVHSIVNWLKDAAYSIIVFFKGVVHG